MHISKHTLSDVTKLQELAKTIANVTSQSVTVYRNSDGNHVVLTDLDPSPYKSYVSVYRVTPNSGVRHY